MIGLGYIVAIALTTGAAGGGAFIYWIQGNRIESRNLRIERLETAIERAATKAQDDVDASQVNLAALQQALKIEEGKEKIRYVEVERQIFVQASSTRKCFPSRVTRVLNADDTRRPDPQGQGAGGNASTATGGTAADSGGSEAGGTSELAAATWMNTAKTYVRQLELKFDNLADFVKTLPCVEVVP